MTALALLALAALSAAPPIDLALAERTGPRTARLTLLKSDARLQAICLDLVGYTEHELKSAQREARRRPIWLYLGPRRIARGFITGFESAPSPTEPCAVAADAEFEDVVPLAARGDLLWATTRDHGSRAHRPVPGDALARARGALSPELAETCVRPVHAAARAHASGTFVSLVCAAPGGARSSLVYVPRGGAARTVVSSVPDEGTLSLVEIIEGRTPTLVLARELPAGRRVELWRAEGEAARRLTPWPE